MQDLHARATGERAASATTKLRRKRKARKHADLPRPDIIVRRPEIHLDAERSKRWIRGGAQTLVLHALSPTFPPGERFFIKSVMAFKDQIDDPQLLEEMQRFAAQEAVHSREHLVYDEAVQKHYDLKSIEDGTARDLAATWKALSRRKFRGFNGPRVALAVTVALEHVTAVLGRQVLRDDRIFADVDPEFARMWTWHAAEEIEHKAVAFDVFEAVGGTWLERSLALVIMGSSLSFHVLTTTARFLRLDGQPYSRRAWGEIARFLFVSPGVLRRAAPDFVSFFRPGFHPWDHDDRPLLVRWKARYGTMPGPVAA